MAEKEITLEDAAQALAQMTPEDYVALMRYQAASESNLPEAPASMNFRAKSEHGYDFLITLRDWDENRLLDRILEFGKRLNAEASISPTSSKSTAVESVPEEIRITSDVDASVIDGDNVIQYKVDTIQLKQGKKGNYFKIKGGKYTQWGWNAFESVFPENVKLPAMAKDEETTSIPKELEYAYVDTNLKRVVAFAQSA